jgi:hypothetical protein
MTMERLRAESPILRCLALVSIFWVSGLAADWQPHQARYAVYRNGKPAGEANVSFEVQGNRLVIRSEGSGTHGLGRFLGVSEFESVEGYLDQGRFLPEKFLHRSRVAGMNDVWTARYDWPRNTVTVTKAKKYRSMDLGEGALDDLSLKLEIARRLRDKVPDLALFKVDEEEIKPHLYRLLGTELLETSLGCLQTMAVERVRTDGSGRFSRTWYAPDLDFVVVRMERGKTGGPRLELRITELVLAQNEVKPKAGCAAVQASRG